jgi:AP endonuclease-1
VDNEKPDIFCLQETKCAENQMPAEAKLKGYHSYLASGKDGNTVIFIWIVWLLTNICQFLGSKSGYAGVALYSKVKPLSVKIGIGIEKHDGEGRVITAEYDNFYLVNAYVPNAGRGLVTLPKRLQWNKDFHKYLSDLDKKKPVILTGDLNVSHLEIDLARPKSNTRSAGFTQEERDGFSELLSRGFIDTFRELYPDKEGAYTYWTYMNNARAKNVGWRLDYFVISKRLRNNLCDNIIRSNVLGSDHCPLVLTMHM